VLVGTLNASDGSKVEVHLDQAFDLDDHGRSAADLT
jgi:hypothetical protein